MNKKNLSYCLFALLLMLSCSDGKTLKEIAEMSEAERSTIQELKIKGLKGDGEFHIEVILNGFKSLKKLEIDSRFKGSIHGNSTANFLPAIETVVAKGLTKIGHSAFYGCTYLTHVEMPNVVEVDNYAFGGGIVRYTITNQIEELDFPRLRVMGGGALDGCANLKVLKLGSDQPIACYVGLFGDFPQVSQQVELYLGEYEYTHNVKGNKWTIHSQPNEQMVSFERTIATGEVDVETAGAEGKVLGVMAFKNIYPYK